MSRDPSRRLGSGPKDAEEIKAHAFFKGMRWEDVCKRKVKLPRPDVKDEQNKENIWISDAPAVEGIDRVEGWDFLAEQ